MVEPTLEEMLDEPIVRLLMKRDGVTRHTVDDLIRTLRSRHHNGSHEGGYRR